MPTATNDTTAQAAAPESYIKHSRSATSFVGKDAVSIFRLTVIANAIRFYAETGMRVNRAYTPTAMLKAAAEATGKTYKRGQFEQAAADLDAVIAAARAAVPVVQS